MERANDICNGVVAERDGRVECFFDAILTGFDAKVIENPASKVPLKSIDQCAATPEEDTIADSGLACAELDGNCVYNSDSTELDCIYHGLYD